MTESETLGPSQLLELERELMRKERQIEYLQTELRRYHSLMEELKQGMRPIGSIEEVREDQAYVRLSGGQAFQVSVPPELRERVAPNLDAVLSPTKGVIVDVIERPKDQSLIEHLVEEAPQVYYEDVIGLDSQLSDFRRAVEWILDAQVRERRERIIKDPRLLQEAGSVLLFGPPGTGKTYMAKSVAGSVSLYGKRTSFIKIESYEIVSKWLGESAKNVKEIFRLARERAPSILFVDELDAIGRARMETTTDAGRDVQGMLNQILTELGEGFNQNKDMVVTFATNFPSVIDQALMNRMRKVIYVPPPKTPQEIQRIFTFYLSKMAVDPDIMKRGELSNGAFSEIWSILKSRKLVYEAHIPSRETHVREEYCATPRDIKNLVTEAAHEVAFDGREKIALEDLIKFTRELVKGGKPKESAIIR